MTNIRWADEWNGETGRQWIANEERHDAALAAPTVHLVAAAAIAPTDRVLDIGCGCGRTSRMAAALAGAGTVLGVDIAEPMIEQARARADRDGLHNARYQVADVQVHAFPDAAFDVALSRFGVMFFDDPLAAFGNVRRALRPGGRLAFLCWQALERNEVRTVPLGAVAAHVELPPPPPADDPGAYSLADPDRTRGLLTAAGFAEVRVEPVLEPLWVGADAAHAADFLRQVSTVRLALAGADEDSAARAVAALRDALVPYQTPDGVFLGSATWLVTAVRPAAE